MIKVIDNQFNFLGAIDEYTSFISTQSFFGIGGFELHLSFDEKYKDILIEENIIFMSPEKAFVILYREINSAENSMIIKGKQLKHYISRQITKPPAGSAYHRLNSNAETIMKEYVNTNISLPNFTVATNQNRGESLVFQTRYKYLNEELGKIGIVSGIGWNIYLDLVNKKFVFDVAEGLDRTTGQAINPPAIFSVEFDNVGNQTLVESKMDYKNVAIVAGQGSGADRVVESIGVATGFERYETFVDARDVENVADLPDRGLQKLAESEKVFTFESEILTNSNLIYEEDYDLGDVVTAQNKKWNVTLNTRITEITEIYEASGFRLDAVFGNNLPTLMEVINKKIDEPVYEESFDFEDKSEESQWLGGLW